MDHGKRKRARRAVRGDRPKRTKQVNLHCDYREPISFKREGEHCLSCEFRVSYCKTFSIFCAIASGQESLINFHASRCPPYSECPMSNDSPRRSPRRFGDYELLEKVG